MAERRWHDLGPVEALKQAPLREVRVGRTRIALSWRDGRFGAISGVCNHVGGPLGEGRLDGDYVVCPWHYWKFQRETGSGEPGYEADQVPRHALREEGGHLFVDPLRGCARSGPQVAAWDILPYRPFGWRGGECDGALSLGWTRSRRGRACLLRSG